jgi:serine/threonine protein kinase
MQDIPIHYIDAETEYAFDIVQDAEGMWVPARLGIGAFAKVLRGRQLSHRRENRPVAIKILRNDAKRSDENLFEDEIRLLRALSSTDGVHVVKGIDVIDLSPLILCGATGRFYAPSCPTCGHASLRRDASELDAHPTLGCGACDYRLNARFSEFADDLFRPPAKPFATQGPHAHRGTIINFVDRKAIIMEVLSQELSQFLATRRQNLAQIWQRYARHPTKSAANPTAKPTPVPMLAGLTEALADGNRRDRALLHRAILLEKVRLMAQLGEAMAWLHGEKRIVHKDIAPDNVMVGMIGGMDSRWRGEPAPTLRDFVNEMVTQPIAEVQLIDFGLSDRDVLSRNWYDEQPAKGNNKLYYISPEASRREEFLNKGLDFDLDRERFEIPSTLADIEPSDIIADDAYPDRHHDLYIQAIEPGANGIRHARYQGTPPPQNREQRLKIVRRLGEAHDIYSLGAVFYFILTHDHRQVGNLKSLVETIQETIGKRKGQQETLTRAFVNRYPTFRARREAIPEPFVQDDLLMLILRMMVRGASNSFVHSRIERGPHPAQAVLREVTRIHHDLLQSLLTGSRVKRSRALALGGLGLGLAGLLTAWCCTTQDPPDDSRFPL